MADGDRPPDGPPPQLDVPALAQRVEERLLGGRAVHTRADVVAATGIPPEEARQLWQALGFATVDDDERAFTDGDIAALQVVGNLRGELALDDDRLRSMTRMLGRTFSRLASWQGQLLVEQLTSSPELLASEDDLMRALERLLDAMEAIQSYVWRRQLAAYLSRVAANAGTATGAETTLAVGFADMAQFTAFTRRSSEADLRAVLEEFEAVTTEVVASHRGQIVKMIGDEVFFIADDPHDAAEIALGLLDAAAASAVLPPLRVGLAVGLVMSRLGDVYGQPVNIASRLTSLARPESVLVDEHMAEALAGDEGYSLTSLRPAAVRGYRHLRSWRLRRR